LSQQAVSGDIIPHSAVVGLFFPKTKERKTNLEA
jgi:hypothetical protein